MTECIARQFCQLYRKPVIFDPVGVGATSFRRTTQMVFSIFVLSICLRADLFYNVD